jgi:hypothetical protein
VIGRRTFGRRALFVLVVPSLGKFLVSCSSEVDLPASRPDTGSGNDSLSSDVDDGNVDGPPPDAVVVETSDAGDVAVFTSTVYVSHQHTFTLPRTLVDGPDTPTSDVNGETSVDSGHAHTVAITVAQLQQVQSGTSVTITTGRTNAHTHMFTFTRV